MSGRVEQILAVLEDVRSARPTDLDGLSVARRRAVQTVAQRLVVHPTTVADKCYRQLGLASIREFDALVFRWVRDGDGALRRHLEAHISGTSRGEDVAALARFFEHMPAGAHADDEAAHAVLSPPAGNGRPRKPAASTSGGGGSPIPAGGGIPDYQTLMLPLLQVAVDGQDHRVMVASDALASHFGLSDDDRARLLPSGRQPVFYNRVHWARSYLKAAGLIEDAGRGAFRITASGRQLLAEQPRRIDIRLLERYPTFVAFRYASRTVGGGVATASPTAKAGHDHRPSPTGGPVAAEPAQEATPEELLERSHRQLLAATTQDLLDRVKRSRPQFFEQLVLDVLVAMGYGGSREDAAQAVGRTGDGGIDGIIKEDRLGLDAIYVQAKRWNSTVGAPEVRSFAGALIEQRANKGVMLSTAEFSPDARRYVASVPHKIVLIGGQELARLMVEYGVGVTVADTYKVYKVDTDYFGDE